MVNIQITMRTEDVVEGSCSTIQLYVNKRLEAELYSGNHSVIRNLSISEPTAQIELVRKYSSNPQSNEKLECGPIKKTILGAVGFVIATFVVANSLIEPFECTHEAKETFMVEGIKNNAIVSCTCGFDEKMTYPQFSVSAKDCTVYSTNKEYSISESELRTEYSERKKYIRLVAIITNVIFACLLLGGVISGNYVTALFSGIILFVITCCWTISTIHLNKLFQSLLKQV